MKNFNLRKIMKRAWQLKKENKKNLFTICLKLAWEEAKMEEKQEKGIPVEYSCGHTVNTVLIRPRKKFKGWEQWRVAQLQKTLCPDCYEAERKAKIEKENNRTEEKTKEKNLLILTGSEKQISWATTIRIHFLEELERYVKEEEEKIEKMEEGTIKKIRIRNYRKVVEVCDCFLKEKETAKWWIENRKCISLNYICDYAMYGDEEKIRLTAQEIIEKYK